MNVMTQERLAALKRLRDAYGHEYDGCQSDAYQMFLVVDECFCRSELEDVATWLPATDDTVFRDGQRIMVAVDLGGVFHYDVWSVSCDSENPPSFDTPDGETPSYQWGDVSWYLTIPPHKLPAMKIQEVGSGT